MVNREMRELVEIISSDDLQSLHKKPVVQRNEKFIFSKLFSHDLFCVFNGL